MWQEGTSIWFLDSYIFMWKNYSRKLVDIYVPFHADFNTVEIQNYNWK